LTAADPRCHHLREFGVTNCGEADMSEVTVTDTLLGLNKYIGDLAAGDSCIFIFDYRSLKAPMTRAEQRNGLRAV